MEFFCEALWMFKIAKNTIAENFNGYIAIIVVMNSRKKFSIFPLKLVPWHFQKYFSAKNSSSLQYTHTTYSSPLAAREEPIYK